jgi:hypothetical protein
MLLSDSVESTEASSAGWRRRNFEMVVGHGANLKFGLDLAGHAGAPDVSPRVICSAGLCWAPGLVLKGERSSCPHGLPAPA